MKSTLCKRNQTLHPNIPKSPDVAVNEVLETVDSMHVSHMDGAQPSCEAADEEDLLGFFDWYSNLMSPNSD